MEEAKSWVKEMGLTEEDYEFYFTTSEMGTYGKKNRDAFYNDIDLEKHNTKNKLRIMFAINQYNEGVHAPGLDGVIMGRSTQSDIVFFEQLGRALSVGNNNKKEYDILNKKTKEELIEMCKNRDLNYNVDYTKEMLIDILLAPTMIDLSGNIRFIKTLENNLKDRVREITKSKEHEKREIHLGSTSFDIDLINEDLFKIIEYIRDRLTMIWEDKYELAKAYYEHHGNLEIPIRFKTINGYEYDENGVALGNWIKINRVAYSGKGTAKITPERIKLLEEIGIIWFSKSKDAKLQEQIITEKNKLSKQKEILNRVNTLLNKYNDQSLPSKEQLNSDFTYQLERRTK